MAPLAASLSFFFLVFNAFSPGETAHIRNQHVKNPTCGYDSCPKIDRNKLNIHLVAHTHDDVGWLKTVDQYYFGSRSMTQKAGVQYIIDTVVEALRNHPDRRFIYVETSFLWKWWQHQDENIRAEVRSFINDGRLEIIGGGWSMNDEATTHYHSLIDQYTWGFRRLNDTFGECSRPRIGWQIDPFGHSREQASIFAQMGFDGMFFGRLDYQDKSKRLADKTAEFLWKASPSLGMSADLFSVALFNNYSPPPGFCFDVLCADEPMIDDPDSPDNNIDARVKSFIEFTDKQALHYRTNNIILTMGGDFTYQHAQMWYKNLDKLISTIRKIKRSTTAIYQQVKLFMSFCERQAKSYQTNNIILTMGEDFNYQDAAMWFINLDKLIRYTMEKHGSDVNVFYSTPSCYLKSLNDANMEWPTKSDDFFPYASDPHAYWTGYFSSRPTLKFYERMGNNFLQIGKQLSVLTNLGSETASELEHFREAMGVMQHHDAVTGTEKQHVADDYARILHKSMKYGSDIASNAFRKWVVKDENTEVLPTFHSCMLLNISACTHTEQEENFVVTVYNSMSRRLSPYVRIPVNGNAYTVRDSTGTEIVTQLVTIPRSILNIFGRKSRATNELVFRAFDIAGLGYKSFYVSRIDFVNDRQDPPTNNISSIGGEFYDITVNEGGKVLIRWKKLKNMTLEQSFVYYEGAEGNNEVFENRSSGAYIFRPNQPSPKNINFGGSYKFYKGPLVEELHLTVNEWVSQVVRIYNGEERIEFDWLVGPIPTDKDKIGKEIVTRYSSNLISNGEFYTDSNAREMLKRKKNFRPTWDLKLEEPISGNYYPVTSKIYLSDNVEGLKLSVLTDRAQGGSSLQDGQLELMLHRRLLKDDAFGVGEALNETAYGEGLIARGKHYVFGTDSSNTESLLKEKNSELELALRPWILITPANDINFDQWTTKYKMQGTGMRKELPPNVHVLTLEPWKDDSVLFRLEHLFEIGQDPSLSQPVEINIQKLFSPFTISSIRETTLGANQWIEDESRLKWNSESNDLREINSFDRFKTPLIVNNVTVNVLLHPKEIRTFVLTVSRV